MAILLSDKELEAMDGLPHAAIALYVMGIRRYMDRSTGMSGLRSNMSWRTLAQHVYVEPHQGRQGAGPVHVETVRRLAALLERTGLIVSKGGDFIVFLCKLAVFGNNDKKFAQNKPDKNPTGYGDRGNDKNKQCESTGYGVIHSEPDRGLIAKADSIQSLEMVTNNHHRLSTVLGDDETPENPQEVPPLLAGGLVVPPNPMNCPPQAGGFTRPPWSVQTSPP